MSPMRRWALMVILVATWFRLWLEWLDWAGSWNGLKRLYDVMGLVALVGLGFVMVLWTLVAIGDFRKSTSLDRSIGFCALIIASAVLFFPA